MTTYTIARADGTTFEVDAAAFDADRQPGPPVVPNTCGPAQAKIVLWEYGLLDAVEAMIAAHPYKPVSIWYTSATVWERSHPYLAGLAYELDLSDEQIDAMFTAAQTK